MTHFVVVGLGSIGRRHAINLAALRPQARFTFVRRSAEPDELSERLSASVVSSLADIEHPVDLAVLATPSADHAERLPFLIDSGWPLLIEKPIVSDASDCDRIGTLLEAATPAVRVAGFNLRYLPSLQRLRREIIEQHLGNVVRASFVAGQWLPDWRPGTDHTASYSADASRGGGVELDLSHEFDMARWLFGDLKVIGARGQRSSKLRLEANDSSVSVLSPQNGPGPAISVSLDYVSRRAVRRYDIVGDQASLTWSLDGTLERIGPDQRVAIHDVPAFDLAASYIDMMRSMLEAVETGEMAHVQSLRDGLASSRLAIAVRDLGSRT